MAFVKTGEKHWNDHQYFNNYWSKGTSPVPPALGEDFELNSRTVHSFTCIKRHDADSNQNKIEKKNIEK